MRRCKPSAAFVEAELAMGLFVGGAVKPGGEGAVVVAAMQRRGEAGGGASRRWQRPLSRSLGFGM